MPCREAVSRVLDGNRLHENRQKAAMESGARGGFAGEGELSRRRDRDRGLTAGLEREVQCSTHQPNPAGVEKDDSQGTDRRTGSGFTAARGLGANRSVARTPNRAAAESTGANGHGKSDLDRKRPAFVFAGSG